MHRLIVHALSALVLCSVAVGAPDVLVGTPRELNTTQAVLLMTADERV